MLRILDSSDSVWGSFESADSHPYLDAPITVLGAASHC